MTMNGLYRLFRATEPDPPIRWENVVRIEATGFDAIGPFEVALTFTEADGTESNVFVHHKSYNEIVRTLHERFPGIVPTWYEDLMSHPASHVECVLFERSST
jgi:hypothetical protein